MRADREALGRALWNLLDNAGKYSPPDTMIAVEAESSNGSAWIRVRNEGLGIPIEEQPFIFDTFFRGSMARTSGSKGTGLGLAMVKHIVEAHHGVVSVESRESQTTFTIQIPIAEAAS